MNIKRTKIGNKMNNMTREELIATFGEETGNMMFDQMAGNSGGGGAPFSFIKKISDHDSELGKWGEHVVNVKTEKNDNGEKIVTDPGVNLGTSFDIFVVNIGYQYSRWNDEKERTETSNAFTDIVSGIASAVNSYSGEPLPASKEDKKAADWKMKKVMGVLVRKDAKSEWIPAIYEVSGKTYYTFGVLTDNKPSKGLMDGIYTLKFVKEKKGSTTFTIIDTTKAEFTPRPADFFQDDSVRTLSGDLTTKMTEWRASQQYSTPSGEEAPTSPTKSAPAEEDNVEW